MFAGTKAECEKFYDERVAVFDSQMEQNEQEEEEGSNDSQSVVEKPHRQDGSLAEPLTKNGTSNTI